MDFMSLPSNALFSTTKDSQAKFLVETDPAFSNYKNWLSSDYMLDAMELDPATKQKRLGDGYYEQGYPRPNCTIDRATFLTRLW
jgi:filamentous hemagglutinin